MRRATGLDGGSRLPSWLEDSEGESVLVPDDLSPAFRLPRVDHAAIFPSRTGIVRLAGQWRRAAPEVEILFMGNSHIANALDCRYVGLRCFNAALGCQDLARTEKTFARMLDRENKLRFVVIDLSYISFGVSTDSEAPYMALDYLLAFGIWPARGSLLHTLLDFSMYSLYRQDLFDPLRNHWAGEKITADSRPDRLSKEGRITGETHARIYGHPLPRNIEALGEILELARRHGVGALLITVPVSRYYDEPFGQAAKQRFYDTVRELRLKHPGVPYTDFSRWTGLDDGDWADGQHMNPAGARKFSTMVNDYYLPKAFRLLALTPRVGEGIRSN